MSDQKKAQRPTGPQPLWMKAKIEETERLRVDLSNIDVLVGGEFGTGKTRFASTFPTAYWIDVDYGMATTRRNPGDPLPNAIRLLKKQQPFTVLMSFLNDCAKRRGELDEYRSIVLDGWTELADTLFYEISGGSPDPKEGNKGGYDEYGSLRIRLNEVADALRTIPYHTCSTVITAMEKDEATGSFVGVYNILGGFRKDIGKKFDEVYILEKRRARSNEDGDVAYDLITEYHPKYSVKSRLHDVAGVPSKTSNPTFDGLYGKLFTKEAK